MQLSSRLVAALLLAGFYLLPLCARASPTHATTSPGGGDSSSASPASDISLAPSVHGKGGNNFLVLISRTPSTLFINGRRVAHLSRPGKTVLRLPRAFIPGDVLTLVAAPSARGKNGVMLIGNGVATGVKWRAQFALRDALKDRAWTRKGRFNAVCTWKPAGIVDGVGKGGASFVWPRGRRAKKHVARFRFVVGGGDTRTCKGLAAEKDMAVISVAATDRAWVFVNGRHIMDILSRTQAKSKRVRLEKGDVVSVKAMDVPLRSGGPGQYGIDLPHEFGFVVDVHYRGQHITTRPGNGPWKVTAMYKTPDPAEQFAFMRKGFDDCSWSVPVRPEYPPSTRAKPFPYNHGARYVWAGNAQRHSTIVFARLVIEDDPRRCGDIRGQSGDDDPSTCACEMVPSADGSVCYYFIDSRTRTCDDRRCEPKYVCTGKEETPDSLICVRKHITHRIVPIDGEVNKCKLNPDSHHIYVPYHKS